MAEKIQIGDKWYVAATSARTEESPQVLKNDETFVMFDRFGDLQVLGPGDQGLYHEDTRYLSYQELLIDGARPLYLGATVKENNSLLIIELMNPDLTRGGEVVVGKGTVHIFRAKLLWQGACYEHIRLTNHGREPVEMTLALAFDADFVDLFEVRGMTREQRGDRLPARVGSHDVELRYLGRDARPRSTRLEFSPTPTALNEQQATFDVHLDPGAEQHLYCTVSCLVETTGTADTTVQYEEALRRNNAARRAALAGRCIIETSNPLVNLWLDRSVSDLAMLTTGLTTGPYPYAGVPWYSTTFGRDGILTAREYLWIDPSLARGVLAFLAATQASEPEPERDADPGKILHEARRSEMARTGEIPFGRYYGTVDATPLFVALAGAYHQRTGDLEFIRSIWPQLKLALEWMDRFGDVDGDGFVEYARRSREGLVQQGWKDSQDSVFHEDGRLADAPIALCEVQAYVYEAKLMASELARHLHEPALADRLREEAHALKHRFGQAFWCEDLGTYAIALDGDKKPCRIATSNAGHALWTGIATPAHAHRVVQRLMRDDSFCGWGIRTVASGQARYNPMSYHNGSVWPHDNALIAAGMARYGYTEEAMRVFTALFDASLHFDRHRLPELFCGFPRRAGEGPTLYPVACSPQAWAAAAVFGMLQACLGLDFHPAKPEVALRSPRLPPFIQWMKVQGLAVREHSVDLLLQRYQNNVGIEVIRKEGDIEVTVAI
ncbi:amylo-alpha-1,6-glucosidase [Piscinibacter sp. XHJ-5]|uniref:amylo-alpha-1,6-glucosidase n=1 Tax=Piscinibacter sp. XHJ-5 TaxID=3037797 RepID=UPI0024535A5C|nr:amylo-alpha-1,6-glucosidase [Piscinibacter sp. XHJ-5]